MPTTNMASLSSYCNVNETTAEQVINDDVTFGEQAAEFCSKFFLYCKEIKKLQHFSDLMLISEGCKPVGCGSIIFVKCIASRTAYRGEASPVKALLCYFTAIA